VFRRFKTFCKLFKLISTHKIGLYCLIVFSNPFKTLISNPSTSTFNKSIALSLLYKKASPETILMSVLSSTNFKDVAPKLPGSSLLIMPNPSFFPKASRCISILLILLAVTFCLSSLKVFGTGSNEIILFTFSNCDQ